jgi:hypothetical protein
MGMLRPLAAGEYGEGYPLYMRSEAFQAKQLEALAGSYAELMHDTLLYQRPSVARTTSFAALNGGDGGDGRNGGEGEGEAPPPARLPKGLVEPNPEFWDSAAAAVASVEEGFRRHVLFPGDLESHGALAALSSQVRRLGDISRRELAGEPLPEDDYEFIRTFGVDRFLRDEPLEDLDGWDYLSGVAADVQAVTGTAGPGAPGPGGVPGAVHEATGAPDLMYVLAGNDGEERVCVGVAYNHYEFRLPPPWRLTDAEWRAVAYRGSGFLELRDPSPYPPSPALPELPPKPFWYEPASR